MSEVFEGVLFPGASVESGTFVRRIEPLLPLETVLLGDGLVAVYRTDPRVQAVFSPVMDQLGATISEKSGQALLVRYDSRTGHRSSILFDHGNAQRSFTAADELFVPLDEDGQPQRDSPPIRADAMQPDQEYETIANALQMGLAALGRGQWKSLFALITK